MAPSPVSTSIPYVTLNTSDLGPLFHKSMSTDSNPIIAPRHFNDLDFSDSSVTKSSLSPSIRGELHFYRNLPSGLEHLFPTLISYTENPITITIARVHGLTLSTLLTSGQMRRANVETALKNLHALHTYAPQPHVPLLYANHCKKVESRFRTHEHSVYKSVGLTYGNHFNSLLRHLAHYESCRRARPAAVIHGDPVLTNLICESSSDKLKFIDMRGAQGGSLTVAGDAIYDLAKVFQSLIGYDFILSDIPMDMNTVDMLSSLLSAYWKQVERLYPEVSVKDIVTVCCALYTSLIPLHDDEDHRQQFAIMASLLLEALDNDDVDDAGCRLVRRAVFRLSCATQPCA